MKTKDCVNYLVQQYPETKTSDWKRRSKKRLPDGTICRTFERIEKSGAINLVDVMEHPETTAKSPRKPQQQIRLRH
jgi:hypothetical protein